MANKLSDFPVTGIGASAGGVKALRNFFDHLPPGSGMAFVVVIHLDPKKSSNLNKLLGSHTEMTVSQVRKKTKIKPNHVYIIAPGNYMHIRDGYLLSAKKEKEEHSTINLFFHSLAEEYQEKAISILLSGTGSDGTSGFRAIKEYGGMAMAQDPSEAEYDGMLRSAIRTNLVDVVLPLKDLGPKLIEYRKALSNVNMSREPDKLSKKESKALTAIFTRLNSKTNHDFSHYKRSSVMRRLQRRMQVTGNFSISQYHSYLQKAPEEITQLLKDLLISVTNFFRDPEAFKAFEEEVIPMMFEGKNSDDPIRVWVAGCATGEEAYSIAILLYEYAIRLKNPPQVKLFATDISKESLKTARKGIYSESITADISKERLKRFFTKENKEYRVRKEIKEMVLFSFHDLLGDPPFSNLDLITCRNLLIYFNSDLQSEVLKLFHYSLHAEAFLFLGLSDPITGASDLFAKVIKKKGLFKSRSFSKSRVGLPKIPIWKNVTYGKPGISTDTYKKSEIQFDKVHYTLLARQYAPASIIINDNHEVMHASEGINRYLQYYEGEPSRDLFKMVSPDLRQPLRGMIYQLNKKNKTQSLTTKGKDEQPSQTNDTAPISLPGAVNLIKRIERSADGELNELSKELEIQLARLLVKILEHRRDLR